MPSNHLILCWPLYLPPSIFPSIRVSPSESVLQVRWPKYWSFNFSICLSSEYLGIISFRIDWLDLLAVQGTLSKSLDQHYSSEPSNITHSAFFIVQFSHPYIAIWKIIALARQTFLSKVMSLLLICSLAGHSFSYKKQMSFNFMAAVTIWGDFWACPPTPHCVKKKKSLTVSIVFPSVCHEVMGPDAMIFIFECFILSKIFHSPLSLLWRGFLVLCFLP